MRARSATVSRSRGSNCPQPSSSRGGGADRRRPAGRSTSRARRQYGRGTGAYPPTRPHRCRSVGASRPYPRALASSNGGEPTGSLEPRYRPHHAPFRRHHPRHRGRSDRQRGEPEAARRRWRGRSDPPRRGAAARVPRARRLRARPSEDHRRRKARGTTHDPRGRVGLARRRPRRAGAAGRLLHGADRSGRWPRRPPGRLSGDLRGRLRLSAGGCRACAWYSARIRTGRAGPCPEGLRPAARSPPRRGYGGAAVFGASRAATSRSSK
jgi:hypothetical protein